MNRLDCQEALAHLQDYLKRELTPELVLEVQTHLERCRDCSGYARFEESFLLMLETRAQQGDLSRGGARADRGGVAGGGERQLTIPLRGWRRRCRRCVAVVAWRARTLTRSGALAAWTVGVLVLYGTGWQGGAVLAAFFISSNLVSRLASWPRGSGLDPKGNRRDPWQVYANGAAAAAGGWSGPLSRGWVSGW